MNKVINPLTRRWITKDKDTYNKLIEKGYVLDGYKMVFKEPMQEKVILTVDVLMNEIASYLMNPCHLFGTCKIIREVYHKEAYWKKMYEIFFPGVKVISSTNNYYEAYKISYNLYFLTNNIINIDTYYLAGHIAWTGIVNSKRLIHSMTYMPHLEQITFNVKDPNTWTNYDLRYYHEVLPKVKTINTKIGET